MFPEDGSELASCNPSWVRNRCDALLHIVVIDPNRVRASILEEGLREAGYERVTLLTDMQDLLRKVVAAEPDVIFIDLANPNRDVLEQMFQVSRNVRRPIAMFVDRSDAPSIEAAFDAGVSAYIVDGLRKERSSRSSTSPSAASTPSTSCAMSSPTPGRSWRIARSSTRPRAS